MIEFEVVWNNCRHHNDGWVDKYILVIWMKKCNLKMKKFWMFQ